MVNKNLFKKLKEEYDEYHKKREWTVKKSNEILRKAKQVIFSIHREDLILAENLLKEIEKDFNLLFKEIKKTKKLEFEGALRAALEEYVEAKLFFEVVKNRKIIPISEVNLSFEDYLAGISDLTGELLRKIVLLATKKRFKEVEFYKEMIDEILGELIKFDLIGYLRTKYDQAKQNLRKAEEILYEIKIKREK